MNSMTQLYSASAIESRVKKIAADINADFAGVKNLHVIVAMNGAFMFASDLVRKLDLPIEMHFAGASSYHGVSRGALNIDENALPPSFKGQPVLLIEDIMDSGNTVRALRKLISERESGVLKVAALLKRQGAEGKLEYCGFTVPRGLFVVGYGMDMDGKYRDLADLKTFDTATMTQGGAGVC